MGDVPGNSRGGLGPPRPRRRSRGSRTSRRVPTPRRPKVLWGGVTDGANPLQRLYTALEEEMLELGCYRTEERGYTPHLTLGRVNTPEAGFALAPELPKRMAWQGGRVSVDEVLVYSSEMEPNGPVYTVIGRAPLIGKPA